MARNQRRTERNEEAELSRLATPRSRGVKRERESRDRFGRFTEAVARGMGTPWFLVGLTVMCILWIWYNTSAPQGWRFDSADNGFTALTLILSLQASYAAPLILLAQNRQDDRDRVSIEQDRVRAERNVADVEYLAREVVALRMLVRDIPSKETLRNELRAFLEELDRRDLDDRVEADERVSPAQVSPAQVSEEDSFGVHSAPSASPPAKGND